MLVSDPSDTTHDDTCGAIIAGVDERIEVFYHYGSFQDGVQYALDNGYAVVSRSTTGLADNDEPAGLELLESGGIAVHAHGANSYIELNDRTIQGSIISARTTNTSYGVASEFTITETTAQSWATALVAGYVASYAIDHPTLSFTQIRQALRETASNGGEWQEITGYGTPDWAAAETALAGL